MALTFFTLKYNQRKRHLEEIISVSLFLMSTTKINHFTMMFYFCHSIRTKTNISVVIICRGAAFSVKSKS